MGRFPSYLTGARTGKGVRSVTDSLSITTIDSRSTLCQNPLQAVSFGSLRRMVSSSASPSTTQIEEEADAEEEAEERRGSR
mmetsp:Transcript_52330/g.121682  ORF Transcript_52330/g.121682 Transcript_52330/m.121682 type:complete len:81 (+) Transcript_52330:1086-1328(+)